MIEIWDPETYELPPKEEGRLTFDLISDTSLMSLVKAKTYALSSAFSESHLAFYCRDRKIRIFNIKTGALTRLIDDALQIYIDY
jgi:predicted type IV restriction endonuclease